MHPARASNLLPECRFPAERPLLLAEEVGNVATSSLPALSNLHPIPPPANSNILDVVQRLPGVATSSTCVPLLLSNTPADAKSYFSNSCFPATSEAICGLGAPDVSGKVNSATLVLPTALQVLPGVVVPALALFGTYSEAQRINGYTHYAHLIACNVPLAICEATLVENETPADVVRAACSMGDQLAWLAAQTRVAQRAADAVANGHDELAAATERFFADPATAAYKYERGGFAPAWLSVCALPPSKQTAAQSHFELPFSHLQELCRPGDKIEGLAQVLEGWLAEGAVVEFGTSLSSRHALCNEASSDKAVFDEDLCASLSRQASNAETLRGLAASVYLFGGNANGTRGELPAQSVRKLFAVPEYSSEDSCNRARAAGATMEVLADLIDPVDSTVPILRARGLMWADNLFPDTRAPKPLLLEGAEDLCTLFDGALAAPPDDDGDSASDGPNADLCSLRDDCSSTATAHRVMRAIRRRDRSPIAVVLTSGGLDSAGWADATICACALARGTSFIPCRLDDLYRAVRGGMRAIVVDYDGAQKLHPNPWRAPHPEGEDSAKEQEQCSVADAGSMLMVTPIAGKGPLLSPIGLSAREQAHRKRAFPLEQLIEAQCARLDLHALAAKRRVAGLV